MNCVGVVPELGAHAHWSCDKPRAGALLSHGGPLGALVKITQQEGSYFHDIESRSIASHNLLLLFTITYFVTILLYCVIYIY